jgi:hypothetical protein
MIQALLFLSIILASAYNYGADPDPISEPFLLDSDEDDSRPETKTLELELQGTIKVHNPCKKPMCVRVSGINLCAHEGFDHKDGKNIVLFQSIWASKLARLKAGESKDINYLFLKTWPLDQKILVKPVLHYTFSSRFISEGYLSFDLYNNGNVVSKVRLPDVSKASKPCPEIICVKAEYDPKKMARDLLAEHIKFVLAECDYHRDVIRALDDCCKSNDLSAPEVSTKMLQNLNARSPQNTRIDE